MDETAVKQAIDQAVQKAVDQAVQKAVDLQVQLVVDWSQLAICGLAALVLFSIWRPGYRVSADQTAKDPGILWFAAACGVWAFIGLVQVIGLTSDQNDQVVKLLRTLLSILNSLCLIGAGVHLDAYTEAPPRFLLPVLRSFRDRLWLWTALFVAPLFIVLSIFKLDKIVDVPVSVLIVSFLLYGFFVSFRRRHYPLLAYASIAVFLFQLIAQIPELSDIETLKPAFHTIPLRWLGERWPLLLISKVMVVLLINALCFTWAHERSEQAAIAPATCLKILAPHHDPSGRFVFPVFFRWRGEVEKTIDLEERLYLRILELALYRLGDADDAWKNTKSFLGWDVELRDPNQNIRKDFSSLSAQVDISTIIESRNQGQEKRVCADPANIWIAVDDLIGTSHTWHNKTSWDEILKRLEAIRTGAKTE